MISENLDLKYTNGIEGYHSAESVDYYYDFFKPGVDPLTKQYLGEDYGFCKLLKDAGVPITRDGENIKTYWISGNFE